MVLFQGLLFLSFGAGLLLVDYRALSLGWLPCGPNWLKGRLEFRRSEQPVRFWIMFAGYAIAGMWLLSFAVRLLAGRVAPLPLQ